MTLPWCVTLFLEIKLMVGIILQLNKSDRIFDASNSLNTFDKIGSELIKRYKATYIRSVSAFVTVIICDVFHTFTM